MPDKRVIPTERYREAGERVEGSSQDQTPELRQRGAIQVRSLDSPSLALGVARDDTRFIPRHTGATPFVHFWTTPPLSSSVVWRPAAAG